MDAALDIGNTRFKLGLIRNGELTEVLRGLELDNLRKVLDERKIQKCIVSSVRYQEKELKNALEGVYQPIFLTTDLKLPISIAYNTPKTLGSDRIAAVVGAREMITGGELLVIDCGTCITYDFLDKKNLYHGGAISPSMDIRLKALNHFTANLPLVDLSFDTELVGKSTEHSILSGVVWGTISELEGMINRYRSLYPDVQIVMTGGDAAFFETKINTSIFVRPNLVLEGLKGVLEFIS